MRRHRDEIDGLRSLAVVPVMLFHGGIGGFAGGYVGVDIFFVISGYLITSILLSDVDQDRFSIVRFYERRARRILPALFFVILCCIPFALMWMLPHELMGFGRAMIAVSLFLSNILFWSETGYFAPDAELNPLLHTWSLAVEEQFYVLFPILLFVVARYARRWLGATFALICLASFLLAEYLAFRSPAANFYLLPSRVFELGIGAICALYLQPREHRPHSGIGAAIIGWAGLAAIAVAIFAFDANTPFPSHWALLPTLGTAAIILCASPDNHIGRFLAIRPFVAIGLISYSAYLWHQPLLAFARIRLVGEPDALLVWALIIGSLVLAWISYRFVEQPFRASGVFSRAQIFWMAGGATLVAILAGLFLVLNSGLPNRFSKPEQANFKADPVAMGAFVEGAYRSEVLDKPFEADGPKLLIIGDSFSQDLFNMVNAADAFPDHQISALFIHNDCQIFLGPTQALPGDVTSNSTNCAQQRSALTSERVKSADIVLIATRWDDWALNALPETLRQLPTKDDAQIYFIGGKQFPSSPRYLLFQPGKDWNVGSEYLRQEKQLKRMVSADQFVDLMGSYCSTRGKCAVVTPKDESISYDGAHLTPAGAEYVGKQLFACTQLARFAKIEGRSCP